MWIGAVGSLAAYSRIQADTLVWISGWFHVAGSRLVHPGWFTLAGTPAGSWMLGCILGWLPGSRCAAEFREGQSCHVLPIDACGLSTQEDSCRVYAAVSESLALDLRMSPTRISAVWCLAWYRLQDPGNDPSDCLNGCVRVDVQVYSAQLRKYCQKSSQFCSFRL